jgi:hypothetical protein
MTKRSRIGKYSTGKAQTPFRKIQQDFSTPRQSSLSLSQTPIVVKEKFTWIIVHCDGIIEGL